MNETKTLVTSALPYANGPIHLGHLSGAYLPADIFVRYKRLCGEDVIYICGSDEHGVPITITADIEKVSPQVIIDRFHSANKNSFEKFGMSFDIYSRTSSENHHQTAKEFFLKFYNAGLLNEKKSLQFYDNKAKMFLPDRYVEGTCPKCGFEEARSDECENCGSLYDQSELKFPKSKITGETPELKETSHWYFPLGNYQERLEKYIDEYSTKYHWKENVLQYVKGWFKDGLRDRAVTRDLDWGVKVPLPNAEGKVIYVWFEAVLGYISATKELFEKRAETDKWKEYWQNFNTRYIAFIGKDNIVFHTIIFPAMLMAWNDIAEDKYILPENVPANEFLNFEGKKFSKSRGWGIDVKEFLDIFPADSLRYYLASNLPENKDTDFFWKEFQLKNNSELADILGNFVNRTFIFTHKNFEGIIPDRKDLNDSDIEMLRLLSEVPNKVSKFFDTYKIKDALLEMMNLVRAGNKYFNDSEPWKTIKSDKQKCANTINICLQTCFVAAQLFSPIIPETSRKLFSMLGERPVLWSLLDSFEIGSGKLLKEPEILFSKIEDEIIDKQLFQLSGKEEIIEELVDYDDFSKISLRVAEIIVAEKVKKSNKLMRLEVDLGSEKRQVVSGIAKSYNPDDLIGKKVIIVSNLKPAKLFGLESKGMILAGESDNEIKVIFPDQNLPNGTIIK